MRRTAGPDPHDLLTGGAETRETLRLFVVPAIGALLAVAAFKVVSIGAEARKPIDTPLERASTKRKDKAAARDKTGFLAAEAVGTAFLTFGLVASQSYGGDAAEGLGVAGASSGTAAGMDIGALYICLTSALAYASGSAFNPAVSLAFALQGSRELRLRGLEVKEYAPPRHSLSAIAFPPPPCEIHCSTATTFTHIVCFPIFLRYLPRLSHM